MTQALPSGGILAGGRSSRFGSDKAWALLHGRPLVVHLLDSLRPQVGGILVSANGDPAPYRALGCTVVADAGGAGPLAGVAALLAAAPTPWLLLAPCDAVRIAPDWALSCQRQAKLQEAEVVVLDDGERLHPTCCLLRTDLAGAARAVLRPDGPGLLHWLRSRRLATLRGPAPLNLNTAEDLRRLELAESLHATPG